MCIIIAGSISLIAVLMLLIFAVMQKMRRNKAKNKEELALKGIAAGICERLHAADPDSKWRWVCRPAGFAINGGIARIEVLYPSGNQCFMDVCLAANRLVANASVCCSPIQPDYMALHVLNVIELTAKTALTSPDQASPANGLNIPAPAAPKTGIKPYDEESVEKWYNIVLIDELTALIDNLNATGEACLYIGQDGKAFIEEGYSIPVVYEFGEMPDVDLWDHITKRLGGAGLFAEIQEGNCIFISWA